VSEKVERQEKLKSMWAQLEAGVGGHKQLEIVASDIDEHFERRLEAMDRKAMLVGMSRRICVDLYEAIVALRPEWASSKDDDIETERDKRCVVKVVMTGGADDGPAWQPHIRSKERRKKLASRFKDS
jgi:type I restriction enzyme R subunit